jgi:hypothetical protein
MWMAANCVTVFVYQPQIIKRHRYPRSVRSPQLTIAGLVVDSRIFFGIELISAIVMVTRYVVRARTDSRFRRKPRNAAVANRIASLLTHPSIDLNRLKFEWKLPI